MKNLSVNLVCLKFDTYLTGICLDVHEAVGFVRGQTST